MKQIATLFAVLCVLTGAADGQQKPPETLEMKAIEKVRGSFIKISFDMCPESGCYATSTYGVVTRRGVEVRGKSFIPQTEEQNLAKLKQRAFYIQNQKVVDIKDKGTTIILITEGRITSNLDVRAPRVGEPVFATSFDGPGSAAINDGKFILVGGMMESENSSVFSVGTTATYSQFGLLFSSIDGAFLGNCVLEHGKNRVDIVPVSQ